MVSIQMRWLILACLLVPIGATSCSGHDGCKGTSISDSSLTCNGGERCCKDMTFTCTGASCTVTITGGGHDQFRGSTVFAMDAVWFTLKCTASGLRDCKSTKIYCPMAGTCTCKTCPSSATMYCPDGVTCIGGGATVVHMTDYVCKGTGSNMYCEDIDSSITNCPTGSDKCASVIWNTYYYAKTCKTSTNVYTRPKCPQYYQHKYDNPVYNYVNITNTTQKTVYQIVNKTRYINRTRYVNQTRWLNQTRYVTKYINQTRWLNQTRYITKYINRTRWLNQTKYVTKYINQTRWLNRTKYVTKYINQTRWLNRYINRTRWVEKTRYVNRYRVRWVDRYRYTQINHTNYIWQNRTYEQEYQLIDMFVIIIAVCAGIIIGIVFYILNDMVDEI